MKKTIALLSLAAILTSSCSSSKNSLSSMMNILNAKWALQSLMGENNLSSLFGSKMPFLQFDTQAKKVSGNNSCNNISGPLNIESGNKINLSQLAGTKMACEGKGEAVFMDALSKATNFKVDNGVLKLLNQGQEIMSFVKGS